MADPDSGVTDRTEDVTNSEIPHFVTDRDMAAMMGCSVRKVRRLIKEGKIPGDQYGKQWMCPSPVWERYMNGTWEGKS